MTRHFARRPSHRPVLLALFGVLLLAAGTRGAGHEVVVLPTTGIVDEGMARYLADGIARAERDDAAAVVIKLNTPGGSLFATNDIVGTLLEAKVPVIVWVAPAGGFAASAGTFITLASNVALMAPGTSIGAASPVSGEGEDITGTEGDKVRNDAIAKITAIAEARHRNVDWAVSAVRDAKSSPVSEAVKVGAVDGMAASLDEVLAFANGRQVEVGGQTITLDLSDASPIEVGMNPFQSFIRLLSDPTIAFLLLSVGSAGLIAELWSPNFVTGILGGLAVILAFIGLGTLPLNVGGLLLIILAMVLFGLEVTVTSHGLLGFGGLVCFALGASALYHGAGRSVRARRQGRTGGDRDHDHHRGHLPGARRLGRRAQPAHDGAERHRRFGGSPAAGLDRRRAPAARAARARSMPRARSGPPVRPTAGRWNEASRFASFRRMG